MSNISQQPRLLSFTLDSWSALGRRVSVSLADRVVVLVGRNGAGKSAILEGFEAISSCAIGKLPRSRLLGSNRIPGILEIEILTPTERLLRYKYELIYLPTANDGSDTDDSDIDDSTSDDSEDNQYSFQEYCEYVDRDKKWLWKTETGLTIFNNDGDFPIVSIFGNTNSLRHINAQPNPRLNIPARLEMQWVYSILKGVHFLAKVPSRQTIWRRLSFIKVSSKGMSSTSSTYGLAEILTRKILRRILAGELEEFESLCQRIGLGSRIKEQKFILDGELREKIEDKEEDKDEGYVSSVLLDGVNIGLLSDGTLRVLSILIDIVTPNLSSTIIIEEPEMQIHPGMLAKLLNEIRSYTYDRNLILSTHSPQVVGWTTPNTINLVYRNEGGTIIRKLSEEEIKNVTTYLCEEGDLGEWLYSGVLDE